MYIYNICNNNGEKHSCQGLTKSLINLQVELERKAGPSPKETANSVGYVVGFVFGKANELHISRHNKMWILRNSQICLLNIIVYRCSS